MTFLSDLISQTQDAECPKNFVYWAGLSAISAVIRRNVWIDKQGHYKLFPNLYVFILGPPAARKGYAVGLADKLVTGVGNTRTFSGRASMESIMEDLSKAYSQNGKPIVKEAYGFIASEEFASSIIRNREAFTILTDLYFRYQDTYPYKTKKSGLQMLEKPYLNILGAINPAHFEDIIEEKDLKGGFIGRFLVIHETHRRTINPLTRKSAFKLDIEGLTNQLKFIAKTNGEFQYSDDARDMFEKWYMEHSHALEEDGIADDTGALARIHDTILKVSMCLALNDGPTLIIEVKHIQEAMDACLTSTRFIQNTTFATPERDKTGGQKTNMVLMEIYKAKDHVIIRHELLKKLYRQSINSNDLDSIMNTLTEAKAVTVRTNEKGMVYTMAPEVAISIEKTVGKIQGD